MLRKLLRGLALAAYAAAVAVVFLIAAYTSFSLFVNSGLTTVPDVRGLTRTEAGRVLADQGLRVRAAERTGGYDDEVPLGRVRRQTPTARTPVKRGSRVELELSLGPERIDVPALAGKGVPAAQVTLTAIGLAVGRVLQAFEVRRGPGAIVAHHPATGVAARPQTPVDVVLALPTPAERYLMPDLVYRRYEDVAPFFRQHGFRFGSVKYERYEGVAAGTILRQFPLPGHPVTRRDSVSLVVATVS